MLRFNKVLIEELKLLYVTYRGYLSDEVSIYRYTAQSAQTLLYRLLWSSWCVVCVAACVNNVERKTTEGSAGFIVHKILRALNTAIAICAKRQYSDYDLCLYRQSWKFIELKSFFFCHSCVFGVVLMDNFDGTGSFRIAIMLSVVK